MNVSGILNKVMKNSDKLGLLYGYLYPLQDLTKVEGGTFTDHLVSRHTNLLKNHNISKGIRELIDRLGHDHIAPTLRMGIFSYIAGMVTEGGFLISASQSKALKRFGENAVKGSVAIAFVMGASETDPGNSPGGRGVMTPTVTRVERREPPTTRRLVERMPSRMYRI